MSDENLNIRFVKRRTTSVTAVRNFVTSAIPRTRWVKPVLSILTLVVFVGGCGGGHVEIPHEKFEAASYDGFLSHRIRTAKTEYVAVRFSFTDSTLVITELAPADTRYRLERPPFTIPRSEVVSIAGVKNNDTAPVVAIGIAVFLIVTIATLSTSGSWFGY